MNHKDFHERLRKQFMKCPNITSEIVKSIIELIDPVRTKRQHLGDLEQTEKTYIGTKVEIILRFHLNVKKGRTQDCIIDSTEFDIKCTVGNNWMIPREAINNFCLLVKIDWNSRKISIGTFFASKEMLGEGKNQDLKKSVSKIGRESIKWIYLDKGFALPTEVPHVEWRKAS